MNGLKPCPFCGSEFTQVRHMGFDRYPSAFENGYRGECCDCGAITRAFRTGAGAANFWNTRAERTCRVVKNSRKYVLSDGTELFDDGCSICNGYIGAGENYCSNCGARVEKEDTNGRQRD